MYRFPIEILQNIFHLSLAHEDGDGEGELSLYFTGPLIISHVCRHWRHVAISFGTLWTCLEIDYDLPRIKYDMIHTWVERTNGLPLDFSIFYHLYDDDAVEQRRTLESVTKLLLAEQHRWRKVRFGWSFKAVSPEFTRIDITNMPRLLFMSLGINVRKCDGGGRILPNVNLAHSRSVEEVHFLSKCAIEYGMEPLQNLAYETRYFRDGDHRGVKAAETCLEVLRTCSTLEGFHAVYTGFLNEGDQPEMSENQPHLVHDHMNDLTLDDSTGTFPELVISRVTLPKLETLELRTTSFLETSALQGLFQRSEPPLQRLKLYGTCARPEHLIPALRHVPLLDTLTIENVKDPKLIFEELSMKDEDGFGIICPDLLNLCLTRYGDSGDIDHRQALDALCTLVEVREGEEPPPGRIVVNNDFVISSSHIRGEFEVVLELLSKEINGSKAKDLYICFEYVP